MSSQVPVAIIGIGCKFPGGSDNKDLYYEFLRNKVLLLQLLPVEVWLKHDEGDGMIKPPPERWMHEEWYGRPLISLLCLCCRC